ncbi:TetR/AcrR family transcriptional regulator [Paenibacillus durus]|uniref:HTH tetR-type domain-containing protein n=1 Tax=Paenibacillus durus ATCC 35681 TaxID=1333534 RepID=A0A0F7FEG5_PAEDU|nr:TetR/AcrR family transcriptional regulator [Paenibacillus durus]AKG37333.1 hypothetical protein VK70_24960 [Paenibacillus durus ATCC 35681]
MPRKKTMHAEERRNSILQAGLHIFTQKGYHGTSVREIAKEVGMNEALLYYYFPSKIDLVKAIVDMLTFENIKFIQLAKAQEDPVETLNVIGRQLIRYINEDDSFLRLSFSVLFVDDNEVKAPLAGFFEQRTQELVTLLKPKLAVIDEEELRMSIDAFFNGIFGYYIAKKYYQVSHLQQTDDNAYVSLLAEKLAAQFPPARGR